MFFESERTLLPREIWEAPGAIVKSGVWVIRRRSCLIGPIHEFRP